ncbi:MAG: CocE/NonD family hydrolase, partial [Ilumatobacter sp.]
MTRRTLCFVAAAAMLLASCSGVEDATTSPVPASNSTSARSVSSTAPPADSSPGVSSPSGTLVPAEFDTSPGTEQVTVSGAEPGAQLSVFNDAGDVIADGVVDELGGLVVRGLHGGRAVTVGDAEQRSGTIVTLDRDDHPAPAFYAEQRLATDGLGYVTTRDGTTLSASVWLPGPAEDGPYPTLVEYSGYSPSNPDLAGFQEIYNALGYAYVGVNIRGTGCSGGSFRYFEYVQSLDGYDAVEAVAAQPWALDNEVGMVGVSYSGISQLFVAQTRPPSLVAITPFSVLADSAISTLYPGGILNTGFAVPWTAERMEEARPGGQQWAADRIANGDAICDANQDLRLQNPDLIAEITDNEFWTDEVAGEIAPRLFVDRITVPTFVAGAWQDEQTGGHFATMLDRFTGTDHLYATLMNGLHTEPIGPAVMPRFVEFLDLYVGKRTPSLAAARDIAPLLAEQIFDTGDTALPDTDRFAGMPYDEALATFESEPSVRVLFEEGAAEGFGPRTPLPRFEAEFDAWPVAEAEPRRWFLNGATGMLADQPLENDPPTEYLALPDAVPPTWFEGSSSELWSVDVEYDWQEGGPGTFAAFATEPLTDDTVVVGSGSVDLRMMSNLGDTDLEVTISEIRPDSQELYVQSGWLRASQRALDASASTELRPVHTHREEDAELLPDGEFALVRVELFPFAHAFRAGSRIRLVVDAPGGNRPVWEFRTITGGERVTIATAELLESSLVLPVVDG